MSSSRTRSATVGDRRVLRSFERRLLTRASEAWMVSEADMVGARELCPEARLRYVPNVVDVAKITSGSPPQLRAPGDLRSELQLPAQPQRPGVPVGGGLSPGVGRAAACTPDARRRGSGAAPLRRPARGGAGLRRGPRRRLRERPLRIGAPAAGRRHPAEADRGAGPRPAGARHLRVPPPAWSCATESIACWPTAPRRSPPRSCAFCATERPSSVDADGSWYRSVTRSRRSRRCWLRKK